MYPNPSEYSRQRGFGPQAQAIPAANLMTQVYQWMAIGLGLTGATAMFMAGRPELMNTILATPLRWVLLLAVIGMSVALSGYATRMAAPVAFGVFFLYATLMGVALTPIFWVYTQDSIANSFFVTGGMFGSMTLFGYATKRDLSGWGSFLFMGMIGLVLASIVNIFVYGFDHGMLYWLTTYAGVLIFTGLTAYDTQKIKSAAQSAGAGGTTAQFAIRGATLLYLDFVNIFTYLLRILGRQRD